MVYFRTRDLARMNLRHGHAVGGISPTYRSWRSMRDRCCNIESLGYADYGGAGVKIFEPWMKFAQFLADMGARPLGTTLDRWPNRNGNYEPGNCRWATPKQQANNTKKNRILIVKGISRTMSEWADITGIDMRLIHARLKLKWSVERAVLQPVRKMKQDSKSI